ncbi:6801_t:CDS:2 [Funneliformis caledonium]|uniref:6801_t:CDS:1 n=1 Tax=Funneliformis caledonium TaxID=1117310 RepID=A0A9N8WP71_9GLOM|nr:6801_t:CDS:2 [Funneliformis caledonium]
MSNDTISLETAVETAALTILDFVVPDASFTLFPENTPARIVEGSRAKELSEKIDPAIPMLSEGFLAHVIPTIAQVEEQLRELEQKQKLLLDELKTTNIKMENQDHYEYIALSFSKIPKYNSKLQNIRSTMLSMLLRSKNLKQRVAQLKIMKEQQLAQIAKFQKRERNFDQTVLAAKVVEQIEFDSFSSSSITESKIHRNISSEKDAEE